MHDLLSALDALHSHNFIHRGLDPSHIYLDPRPPPGPSGPQGAAGEGPAPPTTSVRLAGTGYWRRLLDMHRSNPLNECGPVEENVPEGW